MKVEQMVKQLGLKVKSGRTELSREITGGFASDLLSDVIAHAERGNVWLTLQVHPNVVAVAALKELAAVILVGGRELEEETIRRAEEQRVVLLVSPERTFELAGKLFGLGIPGQG